MHYEINVSKDGKHFFATSDRSLKEAEHAHTVAATMKTLLPSSMGFEITMTRWETTGHPVEL